MAEVFLRRLTRWQAEQQREAVADLYVATYRELPAPAPDGSPAPERPDRTPTDGSASGAGPAGGGLTGSGSTAGGGLTGNRLGGGLAGSGLVDRDRPAGRYDRRAFLDRFEDHTGEPGFDMIIASTPALVGFVYGYQADRARAWHPGFRDGLPPEIDELTYASPVFTIAELCVLPTHRRTRVATRLVDQLLTRATGPLATTTIDTTNHPAHHTLTHWGWTPIGPLLPDSPPTDGGPAGGREAWGRRLGR